MLGGMLKGSFRLDFGVLGFWIFFGLRRFSPGWRACALVFIWFALIGLPIAFVCGLFGNGPAFIKVFGHRYAEVPVFWVSVVSGVIFPLEFWMYRVLTRPSIHCLFYESQIPDA